MKKPMLANTYEYQDCDGWLMSEKLDGVRAIWDGEKLLSRNGNQFFAPDWFMDQLPAGECLDGELFIARGMFQKTVSIVRKKSPVDADWQTIRFCVFDAPECAGSFEKRLAHCERVLASSGVAEVVEHIVCESDQHMNAHYMALVEKGAEGIMLRAPGSRYVHGRSSSLLKYKPFQSDEAELVGVENGTGRLANMVGALVVKWCGVKFRIGSGLDDAARHSPPVIGSRISFGYCGLTDSGTPRFPTFLAVRSYE